MHINPIQSAEEAALAAVNLGPALSPSSPIPETTESLTHTYGLLILERDPTGEPTWFACKFCPIFGSKKKTQAYLRLYRTPFKPSQMESHLKRDHNEQWNQYRVLDLEQKRQFFGGKRLPPPTVFQQRMKQLEKSWTPNPRKRNAQRMANDANPEIQNTRPMKRHKLFVVHDLNTPLAIDDDWIGRKSFRPAEPTPKNVLFESRKCNRPLPGPNLGKLLSKVLERYSAPFSEDIQRLVKPSTNHADDYDAPITPPWTTDGTVTFAARALFYLLRGLPVDVTSTLLQETEQLGWPLMQPSEADVNMSDIVEGSDMKQETAMNENLPDAKPAIEPESLVPFVSSTAHFIEMASFLALKRIIEERHPWAIALAIRPCPVNNDALEIMIPVFGPSLDPPCGTEAKEESPSGNTASQPTKVETDNPPPDVADVNDNMVNDNMVNDNMVNDNMIHDKHEQSVVKASAAKLLSLAITAFVLEEARENQSEKDSMKLRRGIHERVKLILMDALDFFCEPMGPHRATNSLKDIANVRKLTTDWLLSTPSDEKATRIVDSNYNAVGLRIPKVERQVEKEVLCGLRLCVRTAKDSFRGNFHSPTIYAREVLNKAIDDFDTTMPAVRQLPTEQDPLHLISVRDSTDAVETVTRLLDFVCPRWPSKLIGVNSNIPGDSPLKHLEKKLVETLKQQKGSDVVIVDKFDDKPPILPSAVMNMTPLQFEELILSYIKENSSPQSSFDILRKQRETLFNRRQDNMKDSWTSYEDLQALVTFVRTIELLQSRSHFKIGNPSRFSGIINCDADDGVSSDRDVEQILRARTLVEVEQRRLLHEEDPGKLFADTSRWKDYLVSWGGNWSNLMPCTSD